MTAETPELRLTPQRRAVLDALRASADHPTAAEVFDRVRRVSPGIGPATVYRTLARLVAGGQALELTLGDGAARYDANTARHDHLICTACGRAVDVDLPVPGGLLADAADRSGFAVTHYDLQVRGVCPRCQADRTRPDPTAPGGAILERGTHQEGASERVGPDRAGSDRAGPDRTTSRRGGHARR